MNIGRGMDIETVDLDLDGDADILIADFDHGLRLFINQGGIQQGLLGHFLEAPDRLPEMPEDTLAGLDRLGHKVARRRPGIYDGKTQLIVRDLESGVLMGASDPRGDGHAAAW